MRRSAYSLGLLGAAFAALGAAWIFNGHGVIRNDDARHVHIPETLTVPFQVRAAYNGERIFFQYRWPADRPGIHMDALRFERGTWRKYGEDRPGPQDHVFLEDRVAMMIDDGGVPEFARYGGYVAIGGGLDSFSAAAGQKEVESHPYLGKANLKQSVVTKYLPQTRSEAGDWSAVAPEGRQAALREAGYFLDFWHWRAHRSNVLGFADDQNIGEIRAGDPGKSGWSSNWDKEKGRPKFMFDPARIGRVANSWDDLSSGKVGQGDVYYLSDDTKTAFDPDHPWKDGDVLPARVLRPYEGSEADIRTLGKGEWKDGHWEVTLSRLMDTGDALHDKAFRDGGLYTLAFAIHRNATGLRWHYVSLPATVGLNRAADFNAIRFEGDTPAWTQPWHTVTLFYPGQVSWPLLTSHRHPGKPMIERGIPVRSYHKEEQLARYGIEIEFVDDIRKQWLKTLAAGLFLLAGLGYGLVRLQAK